MKDGSAAIKAYAYFALVYVRIVVMGRMGVKK
jgi:hypothetical protein